ncbi:hypothetical protein M758_10G070200 [Ceratodon purpureus]|uniref:Uncharacterized protein n=1 Tax=Ceratodon purpureus TaxID=3225 RepID=A0A8T0GKD2_CERPU|nr:hypothetical protein KC19_10G072500 [Ceratodon purpureus]KAG0603153.1 hypothetical protein M758_10G070200 [Ceratodon purpureus]
MKETTEKRVLTLALSFIFIFVLTSELASCQVNILPPDCVTDAGNQTRCYQSYEVEPKRRPKRY